MAKMVVNLDDKVLDKAIKTEMKRLRRRIVPLETTNNKLRDRLEYQEPQVKASTTVIKAAKHMMDDFENRWGMIDE